MSLTFRATQRLGRSPLALALLVAAALVPTCCGGEEPGQEPEQATTATFLRVRRSDAGTVEGLDTAIGRYSSPATDTVVDLIGAIHVADRRYYENLNERFREYDVVLYELVAATREDVPTPFERRGSPVSAIQVGMKSLLGLDFQLDYIDYQQPHLVHADLTAQEFADSMAARGESVVQMFFRMLGQAAAMQSADPTRSSDARLLAALFARDRAKQLKRIMAEEFERSLAMPSPLDGPDGSTIITVRNRRAMDVLAEQIQAGKKRIAIFYGAAHLPDMADQLADRFGLREQKTTWLAAWDTR